MPDISIVNSAVVSAPKDYTVRGGQELLLIAATANVDGSGAAAAFLPALQLLDPAGNVMFTAVARSLPVAAGASANVSWFPGGGVDEAGAVSSTPTSSLSAISSTGGTLTVSTPTGPTANVDMPNSGVSAGTYGDATHTSQVTVDINGRLTSASSIAISGSGGAGGLISLYDSGYLGASAASIDTGAGGVASGHFGLIVFCYLRCDTAAQLEQVNLTFNNDATAIYNVNRVRNANSTVTGASSAATTSSQVGFVPAASQTAKYFGAITLHIPAYDGSSNFKTGTAHAGGAVDVVGNSDQQVLGFSYGSATAISRLAIAPNTGGAKFIAGSRMIVYGTQ